MHKVKKLPKIFNNSYSAHTARFLGHFSTIGMKWSMSIFSSHKAHSEDLHCKPIDWFLYNRSIDFKLTNSTFICKILAKGIFLGKNQTLYTKSVY